MAPLRKIAMTASPSKSKSPPGEAAAVEESQGFASGVAGELMRVLDGLTDPCLVADDGGRLRYANDAARDLLHLRGRVTGRKLPAVLADRQALQIISQAIKAVRPRVMVMPLTFSSDGARSYNVCVMPVNIAGEGLLVRIALQPVEKAGAAGDPLKDESHMNTIQRLGDPLTIIQGYLENLLDGDIKDPVVMRQCLSAMQRQTAQIQRILRSLGK